MFVADAGLHRVAVYESTTGKAVRAIGGQGAAPGLFRAPFGVAVAEGCLVVSESAGKRVQVLTLHGVPLQVVHSLGGLRGVSWDGHSGLLAAAGFDDQCVVLLRGDASKLRRLSLKPGSGEEIRPQRVVPPGAAVAPPRCYKYVAVGPKSVFQ